MDFSKVLVVIFGFHVFSVVPGQAFTNPELSTLDPEIAKALRNKYTSEECFKVMDDDGVNWFSDRKQFIVDRFRFDVPPCIACRVEQGYLDGFTIYRAELAKLPDYTTLIHATFGFPQLHVECFQCTFIDDSGRRQSGPISFSAIQPRFNITLTRQQQYESCDYCTSVPIFFNRVDDGKNVDQVNCDIETKNNKFIDLCNQAHDSGKLVHVLPYAIEKIFVDENFRISLATNLKYERAINLNKIFPCNYFYLRDLAPVSN